MNGRAIPGAYLFRLYVCDKEMSWLHHIGETHQPDWVVYVRDSEKFRLTNVIPERIIFVSQCITIFWEVIVTVILREKKVYTYTCPIPNGFRDRAVSLYRSLDLASNYGNSFPPYRAALGFVYGAGWRVKCAEQKWIHETNFSIS